MLDPSLHSGWRVILSNSILFSKGEESIINYLILTIWNSLKTLQKIMKKSFTLIEVIIAIVVFGIWILTILLMITKNISISDSIKNKTFATFLAKEWIEIIYNKRDSNVDRWVVWNCYRMNANYDCIDSFIVGWYYKVSSNLTWYLSIDPTTANFDDNIVYFHTWIIKTSANVPIVTWFWYDHNSTVQQSGTVFSRMIKFDGAYLTPEWWNWNTSKILKIESYAKYKKWAYTWEVVLESFIWER